MFFRALVASIVASIVASSKEADPALKNDPSDLTADGFPFTIKNKDFKLKNFTMFGQEFTDTMGFTSRDYLPLDNRGYSEVILSVYLYTWSVIYLIGKLSVNYIKIC